MISEMSRMDRAEYITTFALFVHLLNRAFVLRGQYRLCWFLPLKDDHDRQRAFPSNSLFYSSYIPEDIITTLVEGSMQLWYLAN